TPQDGPVIDIQHDLCAAFCRGTDGFLHRVAGGRRREVSSGDREHPGRGDECIVDVILAQAHVGTALAEKNMRYVVRALDSQHDQCSQAVRIRTYLGYINPFARQLLADETSHLFVADAGEHGAPDAETRKPRGEIPGRAAEIFRETLHVLQAAARLLAIKVHRRAPEADNVEVFPAATSARHRPATSTRHPCPWSRHALS